MLITIVSLLVALSIMVLVHELGHMLTARAAGIVVEEFGAGYPPRLLSLWRSKGRIVIGGRTIVVPRRLSVPQEIVTGSLVSYHAAEDQKGRLVLTDVSVVAPEDPLAGQAQSVELIDRGMLYSLNAIPFGGFAKMRGEEDPGDPGSFASKRKLTRIWVLAAGSIMNLVTAVLFFATAFIVGAPAVAEPPNILVSEVAANSPAQQAGLQAGDLLMRVDDDSVETIEGLQEYIRGRAGAPIVFTVLRGEETIVLSIVPRENPPDGEGPTGILLGQRTVLVHHPWYRSLWLGLREAVSMAALTLALPVQLIRGLIPAELARPVGPVGIGSLIGDAVRYTLETGWWYPVMRMLGSLSVALAVTNLLPLPALDGGRILFVIVEAIRGRRVDPAKEGLVHLVGMALLIGLMLLITWQDLVNPLPSL
ncbi:MAG TPA: M50 family metallopeptidase, partial [Anaerolineae bacterium]|nr:M50 family metallopeptidase [Anaerolineae bacterium]